MPVLAHNLSDNEHSRLQQKKRCNQGAFVLKLFISSFCGMAIVPAGLTHTQIFLLRYVCSVNGDSNIHIHFLSFIFIYREKLHYCMRPSTTNGIALSTYSSFNDECDKTQADINTTFSTTRTASTSKQKRLTQSAYGFLLTLLTLVPRPSTDSPTIKSWVSVLKDRNTRYRVHSELNLPTKEQGTYTMSTPTQKKGGNDPPGAETRSKKSKENAEKLTAATAKAKTGTLNGRSPSPMASESHAEYEKDQINNVRDARRFLETRLLMVPDGTAPTPNVMSATLFQISGMAGVPGLARRAMRAAAYLMEEMDTDAIATVTRDAVVEQMTYITEELKSMTEHIKLTITEEIGNQVRAIEEATAAAAAHTKKISDEAATKQQGMSYKEALGKQPDHERQADPRIVAREGIKARQFLMDFPADSPVQKMSMVELLEKCKEALKQACGDEEHHELRAAERLANKGILAEFMTDEGAKWLKIEDNADRLFLAMGANGTGAQWKRRMHNVIAYYVPITFTPTDAKHYAELTEVNNIVKNHLPKLRWAKPPARRDPAARQQFAHLILSFSDPSAANKVITQGMIICGKHIDVRKCKKEPIRCLKCQGWNHMARECRNEHDTCGTCGSKTHKTHDCDNKMSQQCVPCAGKGHPSWSHSCPTFLRKCEDFDHTHPENALPFFPSTEPWSWSSAYPLPKVRHGPETRLSPAPTTRQAVEEPRPQLHQSMLDFGSVPIINKTGSQKDRRSPSMRDQTPPAATPKPDFPHPHISNPTQLSTQLPNDTRNTITPHDA